MSEQCSAETVAPILGLRFLPTTAETLQLPGHLDLVQKPRLEMDSWTEFVSERQLKALRATEWGFRRRYEVSSPEGANPQEKAQNLIRMALLALWITQPTGAHVTHYLHYPPSMEEQATSITIYEESLVVGKVQRRQKLSADDLSVFPEVLEGVLKIDEEKLAITRSLNYLHTGLHLSFLDPRFIMFTVVLESLFSTDAQEIKHKLAERIAVFLGDDDNSRRFTYDSVQDIYKMRSTLAHGGDPKKYRGPRGTELQSRLEGIVQACVKRIVRDEELIRRFSASQKERAAMFTDMIFPKGQGVDTGAY